MDTKFSQRNELMGKPEIRQMFKKSPGLWFRSFRLTNAKSYGDNNISDAGSFIRLKR
jgi:hypothetical protein